MDYKVLIRNASEGDLSELTALYNHYVETTASTFDLEPFTLESRKLWFDKFAVKGPHRLFVAEKDAKVVGYATSSQFRVKAAYDTSVETSVYIDPVMTGKGIGYSLYESLFEVLTHEDIHRVYAGITRPNPASILLHEKIGFTSIGVYKEVGRKFGKYWDVEWFEKNIIGDEL